MLALIMNTILPTMLRIYLPALIIADACIVATGLINRWSLLDTICTIWIVTFIATILIATLAIRSEGAT